MFTSDDLQTARDDTPGLGSRVHLDNCGSALMPGVVVDVMKSFLDDEVRLGGYVAQEQQSKALKQPYYSLASLFGGGAKDYALTGGAVDAWSKVFYSVALAPGDNIVTMYNEYCSNYVACLQRAQRDGVEVRVARADPSRGVDLDHLSELVDEKTKIVSVTHVASSSGQVADLTSIGPIAKRFGAFYLLDACQSVGQFPVNFVDIGCDAATATSRKFLRGPRGIGFLYISEAARRSIEPAMLTNQSAAWVADHKYELIEDATMFEMWERSCLNQLGFGAALDYLLGQGPEKMMAQTQDMASGLRAAIYRVPGVEPACHADADSAIITFNKYCLKAEHVRDAMAKQGIAVQMSSVFHTRLDLGARGIDTAVRVSPHYYNNEAELDKFLNVLDSL